MAQAAATLASMRVPTYQHSSVTELTKKKDEQASPTSKTPDGAVDRSELRGFAWGSAVHGALAVAVGNPNDEDLRTACRELLVEYEHPLDDYGEPTEIGELIELVQAVSASDLWTRGQAAERILVEIPFSVPGVPAPAKSSEVEPEAVERPASAKRQLDLFSHPEPSPPEARPVLEGDENQQSAEAEAGTRVLEGVIDLAFREADGWVIVDYKTDVGTDPDFPERRAAYRLQVDLYSEAWTRLTGEPVKERVLFFTAQGRVDTW